MAIEAPNSLYYHDGSNMPVERSSEEERVKQAFIDQFTKQWNALGMTFAGDYTLRPESAISSRADHLADGEYIIAQMESDWRVQVHSSRGQFEYLKMFELSVLFHNDFMDTATLLDAVFKGVNLSQYHCDEVRYGTYPTQSGVKVSRVTIPYSSESPIVT